MPCFQVTVKYERDVTFYVEAEKEEDVVEFLDEQDDEWKPGEVAGLIDVVSDEDEVGYAIERSDIVANFEILAGKLVEKDA
jgi:hypothetical protein